MVSHVFPFCLKVSTSVKVNFRTAGIFLGYLVATSNKHFQAIIHVVQNCHGGKQKTRWEKTNKGNYHSVKGSTPLLSSISVLCHVNVQRAYFLFSSDYKDVSTSYPQLLYSPPILLSLPVFSPCAFC